VFETETCDGRVAGHRPHNAGKGLRTRSETVATGDARWHKPIWSVSEHGHTQILQFALAVGQSAHDLPQRLRPAQLAKQHDYQLCTAAEFTGMALGLMLA